MRAHADLPLIIFSSMAPLAVLMMNTNLMLDSDVDDPVVEDNMVDDGLFVGLFHCQFLFWMSMIHRVLV